jgi:hypothetical protein
LNKAANYPRQMELQSLLGSDFRSKDSWILLVQTTQQNHSILSCQSKPIASVSIKLFPCTSLQVFPVRHHPPLTFSAIFQISLRTPIPFLSLFLSSLQCYLFLHFSIIFLALFQVTPVLSLLAYVLVIVSLFISLCISDSFSHH